MADTMDASQQPDAQPGTPSSKKTRTLAILKPHILKHRLTIEPRIIEAGFEIVKERMMQFDADSDRDYLDELFGADAATLIGEPIWVYVLERHRAVEVWLTLMGHPDPEMARQTAPSSLRAIYGLDVNENAVAGPPDNATAEAQILALFASSPPFPPLDSRTGSIRSIASSLLLELQQAAEEGEADLDPDLQEGQYSEGGSPSIASTARRSERMVRPASASRKSSFKARAMPASTITPTIEPRMSRAAALRLGLPDPTLKRTTTSDERSKIFENVPGHKRSEAIKVASTAAPAIAPRLTKAASLRMGIKESKPIRPKLARPSTAGGTFGGSFEGVPGHKRRETISVSSTKDPGILPRINRSAVLRQQKDVAPSTSHMFKLPSSVPHQTEKEKAVPPARPPSAARRESIAVASTRPPSVPPRANRSSMLRVAKDTGGSHAPSSFRHGKLNSEEGEGQNGERGRPGLSRASSTRRSASVSAIASESTDVEGPGGEESQGKKKTVASRAPSIEPRSNRSALLRAATMEKTGSNGRTGEPKVGRAFK